jgi:parallel beta-helix repeat protein
MNHKYLRASLFLSVLLGVAPAFAAQFFVAPGGTDASPGTRARPFASPERARDAVRAALKRGEACEVVLRAGNYQLSAPLELGAEDSGTAKSPVVWRAADGESVRLSAGRRVANWKPVSDPQVLARLEPASRRRVLQADLWAQGVSEYGEMSGGFGKGGSAGAELFLDDVPAHVSRYPNEGFISITEALGATPIDVRGTKGTKEGIVRTDDARVARWAQESDPHVLGYWFWDWADARQKVASIDPTTLTLTLGGAPHGYGYRKGQYFYGFNLLSEIDRPGEWFLDRKTGTAYVLPLGNGAPKQAMVTLLPNVLKIDKASHITLRRLTIEGARETAVTIRDSSGVALVGCIIRNSGQWGVSIQGGSNCSVRGCDITGLGDGGVMVEGGDRATLTPANHAVENSHIHHYARWNRTYKAGISLNGVGNRAVRNLIHHAPHQAMNFGGNDHLIEGNEIHNVCEETNDAGAIYAWNDWAARGHVVRGNYIHHIYGRAGEGANGVYLDDNFSSARIENNIFEAQVRPIHLGGGRDHLVSNNLFVDCIRALHIDARGLGWRAYGFEELRQKLEAWPYEESPWTRYPGLRWILNNEPMAPKGIVAERNVFVDSTWDDVEKAALPHITLRQNLFDASRSLLVRPSSPRASTWPAPTLKSDASLRAIGFAPIPTAKIGLYASPERASWPVSRRVDVQTWPAHGEKALVPHPAPPLRVARVERATLVDGVVLPDEYAGAPSTIAETPSRDKASGPPARAWLSHDSKNLYVAVVVPVAKPQSLVRGGAWGAADGIEVALRQGGNGKPGPTFVLQGFPDGRAVSSTDAGASQAASEALLKSSRYAAKVGALEWMAEWSIPLAQFGSALGFNIGVRRTESDEWIAWTGTGAQNWKLAGAGQLVLR